MNSIVADSEAAVRFAVFIGVFITLATLEWIRPRRALRYGRGRRWTSNLGLSVLNTLLVRIFIPLAGVSGALLAQERGWGLFNWIELPL